MPPSIPTLLLSELVHGQEADVFVLLSAKEELKTRENKPYWRVTFRDARREVSFPIWDNAPWAAECREKWTPGVFYKVRAVYRETNYGPQLDIRKIREAVEADAADGFDPTMFLPSSRFDPAAMFEDLRAIALERIPEERLRSLVLAILDTHRERLLCCSAARRHHHAYRAGLLEHTLSVTRTAVYLADKYDDYYPDLRPRLDKGMVVAGAILHDIGKIRELAEQATDIYYTAEGELVGHSLLGRDIVREAARELDVAADTLLRLEHVIISHQRLAEWGAPKPPMTPEALLVHYADDIDAKFHMFYAILRDDNGEEPFTSNKNLLHQKVYRGK